MVIIRRSTRFSSSTVLSTAWSTGSAPATRFSPMRRFRCWPANASSRRPLSARSPPLANARRTATFRSTSRMCITTSTPSSARRSSTSRVMRVFVVGLGVQGHKRKRFAGGDFAGSVDLRNPEADFRDLREVALDTFDAALVCTPDAAKIELLDYLVEHGKHALIEKPLVADDAAVLG